MKDENADHHQVKEHRVPIDHESFYDGRVFGELKSRVTVHMEVRIQSDLCHFCFTLNEIFCPMNIGTTII